MAAAYCRRLHRGAPRRADTARHACAARSPEPVLFLPRLQAVPGRATASISREPPHRARQAAAGTGRLLGDRYRVNARLQPDELVHGGVPQADRAHAHRLSTEPRVSALEHVPFPSESEHALGIIEWRMFLSANRYPLRRNMR